jgi:DNA-binding beta-propeller fold protein YncE
VYVADGYANHRVIVFDADTGAYKRMWGAYGNKPDDTPPGPYNPEVADKQFRNPVHCSNLSKDNLVYVRDRQGDRIKVFTKDGKFIKEGFVARKTLGSGSAWDIAFSADPQQRFIYLADGMNARVHILVRDTLQVVGHIGQGGRYPGQFYGTHSIAVDSKGNMYTGETYEGKRLQRFLYKGLGNATTSN